MRTTMDFPDDMFRRLKALAAMRGMSLKQVLHKAVQDELAAAEDQPLVREKIHFPLIRSKTPGVLKLKNADIDDLLT